ncbi:hypothetical protein ANCDUO_14586 [Ancylostoma duodenale]|uniref:Protein kinase domain-containing protein n=1 Tax=Ancylostoma duodenale TaxID=51022 RepID=A0A0C2GDU6_9BILA|nr:hypothetical protein ANCDUO_14586 [Ancylostoma duodenale]
MGLYNTQVVYIFDFGLARQILLPDDAGRLRYGALFAMIECLTGSLPWRGMVRKEAAKVKENTTDAVLCKACPPSFLEMAKTLRKLTYNDIPPYKNFMEKLKQDLPPKIKMTDPYEWNKPGEKAIDQDAENIKSDRAEADKDGANDKNTLNEVDESVVTEEKASSSASVDQDDFAKEDTLEGI